MHFRIFKMIATSSFLTALTVHQICFRPGGSAPDPAGGAYSAHSDPLAGVRGPTSKGLRGGEGREKKKGRRVREIKEKEGKGRGGKESRNTPLVNSCLPPETSSFEMSDRGSPLWRISSLLVLR